MRINFDGVRHNIGDVFSGENVEVVDRVEDLDGLSGVVFVGDVGLFYKEVSGDGVFDGYYRVGFGSSYWEALTDKFVEVGFLRPGGKFVSSFEGARLLRILGEGARWVEEGTVINPLWGDLAWRMDHYMGHITGFTGSMFCVFNDFNYVKTGGGIKTFPVTGASYSYPFGVYYPGFSIEGMVGGDKFIYLSDGTANEVKRYDGEMNLVGSLALDYSPGLLAFGGGKLYVAEGSVIRAYSGDSKVLEVDLGVAVNSFTVVPSTGDILVKSSSGNLLLFTWDGVFIGSYGTTAFDHICFWGNYFVEGSHSDKTAYFVNNDSVEFVMKTFVEV